MTLFSEKAFRRGERKKESEFREGEFRINRMDRRDVVSRCWGDERLVLEVVVKHKDRRNNLEFEII